MNRTLLFVAAAFATVAVAAASPAMRSPADAGQRAAPRERAQKTPERTPPATRPPAERAVPRAPQGLPPGQQRAVPREQPWDRERPEARGHFGPYWPPFYPVPYVPWYYPYGYYPPYGYPYLFESYGSVRLEIDQKDAAVYADGFYVGIVDDFDGIFQRLNLKIGRHHLEIRAVAYETLAFDVYIQPGRTITYRRSMVPILP
jgi:hypothetical protein